MERARAGGRGLSRLAAVGTCFRHACHHRRDAIRSAGTARTIVHARANETRAPALARELERNRALQSASLTREFLALESSVLSAFINRTRSSFLCDDDRGDSLG